MSIFKRKNNPNSNPNPANVVISQSSASTATNSAQLATRQGALAELALNAIHDGVIMTNRLGIIEYLNPASVVMLDCGTPENALGLDYSLLIKIESKEGRELSEQENPLIQAMRTGQPLEKYQACLVAGPSEKRIPIAISVILAEKSDSRIITFRNITKELAEEGEQAEFISTASHEMRTPVATIDGYLSLCLNPQTATIDERARGYLESAHSASQHLGRLFQDLLDATKLDDGRLRPKFVPIELTGLVKQISDDYITRAKEAQIDYQFGVSDPSLSAPHRMIQAVYGYVDIDFMREILDNLIDNAIKYTPEGGSIYINVMGDGDRALINVTDTGSGISSEDLQHIFQKFYRADNSDTREIGGTGLGLYLAKQRVEAMGGRIWAESAFGEGSTFFVSLPRLSGEEYEKRMIAVRNAEMMNAKQAPSPPNIPSPTPPVITPPPQPTPQFTPQPPTPPQPIAQPQPMPQPIAQPLPMPQPSIQPQAQMPSNNINNQGGTPQ
ncbi:hypothetical protein IJG04_01555 [Candidatus Saccharibacteria bacterium]|nr:hypothetical protein [Candidatus Saccharibacteria bacterium]